MANRPERYKCKPRRFGILQRAEHLASQPFPATNRDSMGYDETAVPRQSAVVGMPCEKKLRDRAHAFNRVPRLAISDRRFLRKTAPSVLLVAKAIQ